MSKASQAENEVRDLLGAHGRFVRMGEQGGKFFLVGAKLVSVPGPHKDEGAWFTARREVRRALATARNGETVQEPTVANRLLRKAKPEPIQGSGVAEYLALEAREELRAREQPAAASARQLLEESLAAAGHAETLALQVDDLVAALAQATRDVEKEREARVTVEKKLAIASAEMGKLNGHDWPRELEAESAKRRKAEAEATEAKARGAHLEQAIKSLTLGLGKGS